MFRKGILREHAGLLSVLFRGVDAIAILIAAFAASRIQFGSFWPPETHRGTVLFGLLLALIVLDRVGLYRVWRGILLSRELRLLTLGWLTTGLGLVVFQSFTHVGSYDKLWVPIWIFFGWALYVLSRIVLRTGLAGLRSRGFNQRHVVLVGMSELGLHVARQFESAKVSGLNIAGYFDDRTTPRIELPEDAPERLGRVEDLDDYLERNTIDQVWIAYPLRGELRVKHALHALRHASVEVRYVLDIFSLKLLNHSVSEVAGIPVLDVAMSPTKGANGIAKEILDRGGSLIFLVLASPLLAAIAIGVKLSSPGPVVFRQKRVSWNNRSFDMLKFRSMPANHPQDAIWTSNGMVTTRFGAFLRKYNLDELLQFVNVLKGDMSMVGPRPERPEFVSEFKDRIPDYMKKHMVKAGITGWAQVNGWRGDTCLNKRIEHDLFYIENWSVWLDLKIILATLFGVGFKGSGSVSSAEPPRRQERVS